MSLIHTHVHSTFSLLDGLIKPEDLAKTAKERGMEAIAITDHGSISGAMKFYKACKEHKVKPIIGIEAYFVDNAVNPQKGEKRYHIILLAKSERGLKSIYRLMTAAHQNFYYVPRFDLTMLSQTEDIVVTSACASGILSHPNYQRLAVLLKEKFDKDFYLEIMPLDWDEQREINRRAIDIGKKHNIPIIMTNDVHYINKEDEDVHNFLLSMHTKGKMEFSVHGLYMKTEQQMIDSFFEIHNGDIEHDIIKETINNTQILADSIDIVLSESEISLPKIDKSELSFDKELLSPEYQERLEYELTIIQQKGYQDYFAMVKDLTDWARSEYMELGAGRGSAAGSLVCYLLGITDVDPIANGLLFERFLNPDRSDYPDIDIDFPRSRRKEIAEYLRRKYGDDRVANISTITEQKTKSAFKDVARTMGVPFPEANRISSMLDNDATFKEHIDKNKDLEMSIRRIPNNGRLEDLTDRVAGTLRQSGTHAAGFVISPRPLVEYGILERKKDQETAICWDMKDAEYLGLVKVDILGLRTLDIIGECKQLIGERHGVDIQWSAIDVYGEDILKEFGKGNTNGIFQFESQAMTHLVKKLAPISSKDILVDANALVRPGPTDSGMTAMYIERHHGGVVPDPPYGEFTNPITKETHGCIIYQEQIIRILVELAGYSIPQADIIRRAFAKKQSIEEFEKHRDEFTQGCLSTSGMDEDLSSMLFDHLENFSRYGFNKSHAAAYTELGLRQMWLKINYPLEYMMSLLKWTEEEDKRTKFKSECERLGIEILLPDINESESDFSIAQESIRIGLRAIKGLGEISVESILKQRRVRPYSSLEDARIRLPKNKVNTTAFQNMIMVGCFDSFGINKRATIEKEDVPDYTAEESEIHRMSLLPGVYKVKTECKAELQLNHESLSWLQEVIKTCQECAMYKIYKAPVPFDYTPNSKIVVLAEAPGAEEVEAGSPLVGKAGAVIWDIFLRFGISREDTYVTNVYKCRPYNNKLPDPTPKDCYDILKSELKLIKPKLVLACGATAREFFTGQRMGIQAASDRNEICNELLDGQIIPVLYTVHPAATFYGDAEENKKRLEKNIEFAAEIFFANNKKPLTTDSNSDIQDI